MGLDNGTIKVNFSQGACRTGWMEIGPSCYQIVDQRVDWDNALMECVSRNSTLAWIETHDEMCRVGELVETMLGPQKNSGLWLGGRRSKAGESHFHWVGTDGVTRGNVT